MTASDEARKAMEAYQTTAEVGALMPFLKTAEHASPESRTKLCGEAVLCITALLAEIAAKDAEIARLRESMTPSGSTKAAYMGEIKDPESKRHVSWTAIKMIMGMISARAALKGDTHE